MKLLNLTNNSNKFQMIFKDLEISGTRTRFIMMAKVTKIREINLIIKRNQINFSKIKIILNLIITCHLNNSSSSNKLTTITRMLTRFNNRTFKFSTFQVFSSKISQYKILTQCINLVSSIILSVLSVKKIMQPLIFNA